MMSIRGRSRLISLFLPIFLVGLLLGLSSMTLPTASGAQARLQNNQVASDLIVNGTFNGSVSPWTLSGETQYMPTDEHVRLWPPDNNPKPSISQEINRADAIGIYEFELSCRQVGGHNEVDEILYELLHLTEEKTTLAQTNFECDDIEWITYTVPHILNTSPYTLHVKRLGSSKYSPYIDVDSNC